MIRPPHSPDVFGFTSFLTQTNFILRLEFSKQLKIRKKNRHQGLDWTFEAIISKTESKKSPGAVLLIIFICALNMLQYKEERNFPVPQMARCALPSIAYCRWIIKKESWLYTPIIFHMFYWHYPFKEEIPLAVVVVVVIVLPSLTRVPVSQHPSRRLRPQKNKDVRNEALKELFLVFTLYLLNS
jgi:hypothetical protein